MGCEAGRCKTSTYTIRHFYCDTITRRVANQGFKAPSPHEVKLASLDINPVFQSLGKNTRMEDFQINPEFQICYIGQFILRILVFEKYLK